MTFESSRIKGIFPAFVTPTDPDGSVRETSLRQLVEHLIAGGSSGLVPTGGSGEFTALSQVQRTRAVAATVEAAGGRVPVIAGVVSPGFGDAVVAGSEFAAAGADALLVVVPFYVTPNQKGIRAYFKAYRDKVDIPILLYDIPYRTHVLVHPETIAEIVSDGSIVGMKACNPDVAHFNATMNLVGSRIRVMSGEDGLFPTHMAHGAVGGILASATLIPGVWKRIFDLAAAGDTAQAISMQRRLIPLLDALFAEGNPGPLKAALRLIGLDVGTAMLPLQDPEPATLARISGSMKALGFL